MSKSNNKQTKQKRDYTANCKKLYSKITEVQQITTTITNKTVKLIKIELIKTKFNKKKSFFCFAFFNSIFFQ